jgi:CBS domain-containing protein/gamma-glutamyl:cysteine ligase YbdK (ATP-grasp superfamily)
LGEQEVAPGTDEEELRTFTQRVLNDLRALQRMHDEDLFESGVRRVGAEQELFLVDSSWQPAPLSMEILERLTDPSFTTELGRFNMEINLDPLPFGGDTLHRLETQLQAKVERVREVAQSLDARVLLTGILPTLAKSDLHLGNMTPVPRYFALNEAMNRLRGDCYRFRIEGRDQLVITHDNVLVEACNTSFQAHFQVSVPEFPHLYNTSQAVTAPVLAAATNSPLLFGQQLWRETRIALFEQSVDTRVPTSHPREQAPRVSFGRKWVDDSAVEIFRQDISRFRVLLSTQVDEDPFEVLDRGEVPQLRALRLHSGTVYRWNRACYGISEGKPHLRIENRVLPAGPTVVDEVANAALWFGLMSGVSHQWQNIPKVMDFQTARENFIAAARQGLGASLTWPERGEVPATTLLLEELIPLARHGLEISKIDSSDIDRYLGIIEERVQSRRTGSQWMIASIDAMQPQGSQSERLAALVAASVERQRTGEPVHTWPLAELAESGPSSRHYATVSQIMSKDLFTVSEEEVVDLVASVMQWRHVRYIPVEDNQQRLVGLVTYRTLLRVMSQSLPQRQGSTLPVREVMLRDVITVQPHTPTREAMGLMREHKVGCLPVVDGDHRLVGILTEHDLIAIARPLLEKHLEEG